MLGKRQCNTHGDVALPCAMQLQAHLCLLRLHGPAGMPRFFPVTQTSSGTRVIDSCHRSVLVCCAEHGGQLQGARDLSIRCEGEHQGGPVRACARHYQLIAISTHPSPPHQCCRAPCSSSMHFGNCLVGLSIGEAS